MNRLDELVYSLKGFGNSLNEFIDSKAGRATLLAGIVIFGLVILYNLSSLTRQSDASRLARDRMFVCSETGRAFEVELEPGMRVPVMSPYSGKNTGYLGEPCYWTREGKIKDAATWVLLNEALRKPGPTFCPDCGRLVVGHNPFPEPGQSPPPLKDEYVSESNPR